MPNEVGKLYVAYGSNLNLERMKHRCPTAEPVGKAELTGWKLVFRGRGMGVANIEPADASSVPVLIWRIYPDDERVLDGYEGVPHFYHREIIPVILNGESVDALVYILNDGYSLCQPGKVYYDIILDGYRSAGFDPAILQASADVSKEEHRMTERVLEQIMSIRDSGETNMLDTKAVQYIANREGYYELVCYIDEHRRDYVHFIFTGKAPNEES